MCNETAVDDLLALPAYVNSTAISAATCDNPPEDWYQLLVEAGFMGTDIVMFYKRVSHGFISNLVMNFEIIIIHVNFQTGHT